MDVAITNQTAAKKSNKRGTKEPQSEMESQDVPGGMATVLDGDTVWQSNTSFSYDKTYKTATNPILKLEDIGMIGLPLSERDALVIKDHANQAAFGVGQRKGRKPASDTWEMDAGKVVISNSDWEQFMTVVVNEVCTALGLSVKPRYELHKLVLYETGSHSLPHVDTQKGARSFATLAVVLPSQFTGGAAHFSHGALSSVSDCSATSSSQTTVMSWYTGVTQELKPITSGYMFVLSYNLIHTANSLAPALSSNVEPVTSLRQILNSWKQNKAGDAPHEIVYLLSKQYPTLRASALKGPDAHKVSVLSLLSKELGFHLGLATVVFSLSGMAERIGGYGYSGRKRGRRGRGHYSSDDEVDVDDLDFVEPTQYLEQATSIEGLVDMEGKPLSRSLSLDEVKTIPDNIPEILRKGIYVQSIDGKRCGLMLVRRFCRTVLVIWPSSAVAPTASTRDMASSSKRTAQTPLAFQSTRAKRQKLTSTDATIDLT